MQYFGSNIVDGVAESWVEDEMNWAEVDGTGWSWVEVNGSGWWWVHGLVIPFKCYCNFQLNYCLLVWMFSPRRLNNLKLFNLKP